MAQLSETSAIPILSSNTGTNGVASAGSVTGTSYDAWNAFDSSLASYWGNNLSGNTSWLRYSFNNPIVIGRYSISPTSSTLNTLPKNWTFEGSNDGFATFDILDTQTDATWSANTKQNFDINNTKEYLSYRINVTANGGHSQLRIPLMEMFELKIVNKILLLSNDGKAKSISMKSKAESLIPFMTSYNNPSGFVSASSEHATGNFPSWRTFNGKVGNSESWLTAQFTLKGWISYKFNTPTKIGGYSIIPRGDGIESPTDWTFEGSNDGVNWIVLDRRENVTQWNEEKYFTTANLLKYSHYRLNITKNNGSVNYLSISEVKMFDTLQIINQMPSHSEQNFIEYGMDSPVQVDGIFSGKNYILQDAVSEDTDGLWKQELDRKPLSIKFE